MRLLGRFCCATERQRYNMNHALAQILQKPLQLYYAEVLLELEEGFKKEKGSFNTSLCL